MEKIKEVIVVEGKEDTKRIQMAVDADTIETKGSALEEAVLQQIDHAQEVRGVIIFTDPDHSGERIRKIISKRISGVKHAFLNQEEARPTYKGSLGIEHAPLETIQKALEGLYVEKNWTTTEVSRQFLVKQGLLNDPDSKNLRMKLGNYLRIGYTNGKQLQKRLHLFGITEGEVEKAMLDIKKGTAKNGTA